MCIYNVLQIPSTKFWLVGRKIGRRWWWLHSVWLSRYHKITIYWDLITVTTVYMYWTSVELKNVSGLLIVVQFYPWFKLYFCKGPLYSATMVTAVIMLLKTWICIVSNCIATILHVPCSVCTNVGEFWKFRKWKWKSLFWVDHKIIRIFPS